MLAIALVGGTLFLFDRIQRSPYITEVRVIKSQPVPFTHQHHVAGLGIDCRYCHTSVESSAVAGVPPTETCMNCHSQIWSDSDMLEPVRESFRSDKSLEWNRIHDLPDFVYFNHSIHVAKGVGCVSCHGHVEKMPIMWKENTLYMAWCLDCHRHPENHLREKSDVFNMTLPPRADQVSFGQRLIEQNHVTVNNTNCSTCHR